MSGRQAYKQSLQPAPAPAADTYPVCSANSGHHAVLTLTVSAFLCLLFFVCLSLCVLSVHNHHHHHHPSLQAEAANPQCHLVLVEDPSEVLDELETQGDAHTVTRAADFYRRQEQYRQQRRTRLTARQQRLAALELRAQQEQQQQQDTVEAEAAAGASGSTPLPGAWMASVEAASSVAAASADRRSSSSATSPLLAPEASDSSIASIDGQPLKVVVHSGADGGSSSVGVLVLPPVAASPRGSGSGSLSSIGTDEDTCGICFDNNNHVAVKYCGHRLCVDCYRKVWELSGGDSTCPFCRARLEGYMYLDWPLE